MSNRVDYEQVAEKLDYAAVDKKLAQLAEREPPRKRKTVADVLVLASIRVLAIFAPLTLPLVLYRNAIHIEPALNPHPFAVVAQNQLSDKMVSPGHNVLLIRCYICVMKVCAVTSRQKTQGAARLFSTMIAMIQPRSWTNSTP